MLPPVRHGREVGRTRDAGRRLERSPGGHCRARDVQLEIRTILLRDWDPIGVGELPEGQDEFDGYVGRVHSLLVSQPSEREVVEWLARVERESMGLPVSPERLRRIAEVAEKLLAVDVRRDRK